MVDFKTINLDNTKIYSIKKADGYSGCSRHFKQASENAKKFLSEGRPVSIVSPEKHLSKDEKEEYRKYFCKKAQSDKINYIYFEDTVLVEEVEEFAGTMFE